MVTAVAEALAVALLAIRRPMVPARARRTKRLWATATATEEEMAQGRTTVGAEAVLAESVVRVLVSTTAESALPTQSPELLPTMRVAEDVVVTLPLVGLVGTAEEEPALLAALCLELMQSPTPEAEAVAVLITIPTTRGVMGAQASSSCVSE